jgi:hypothetical protein
VDLPQKIGDFTKVFTAKAFVSGRVKAYWLISEIGLLPIPKGSKKRSIVKPG